MGKLSRRGLGKCLLAPFLCRIPLTGQSAGARQGRASPDLPPNSVAGAPVRAAARWYRADAVILLLGMPIYRREGVGSGKASIEEATEGAAVRRTLFFGAGSDPKRARGLSRLGWMREVVSGPTTAPSDIAYFGVLTSSPEDSLADARKSVGDRQSQHSVFSAVNGLNTTGRSRSAIAHFEFPSTAAWSDQALINQARTAFQGKVNWRETSWPNLPEQAPSTFLSQLTMLLGQRAQRCSGRYVYNEQVYQLELEGQAAKHDRMFAVRGSIRNLRTNQETRFRVWLEDGSTIPARFEFQPRSFLRLTFTAVAA